MALNSVDAILAAHSAGQSARNPFHRLIAGSVTSVAGRWHELLSAGGTGGAMTLTGSAGVGIALDSSTAGALPEQDPTTSPLTRRLMSLVGWGNAATLFPATLLLTDLLYLYPSCGVQLFPTTLDNTAAKPTRFNSGAGVMASAIITGALGAAQPQLGFHYTNSGGTNTRLGFFKASANSMPAGALLSGGFIAAIGSPYMSMEAADSGVQQLDQYAIGSGTTGTVSFLLHRPIATIPLTAANIPGERDLLFQPPTLPKIDDDACLGLLVSIGGALVTGQIIMGEFTTIWG